ncbi:sugar ABC transporter substrate-binding protein [Modestobacter marinus]|uniref:sugar ABC transporter substrate-binding protein n=1 Tax=Modestobacter marinus TaxID=477641 RepID=UPI001C97323A|nr:substrate-binding domain-containing protein [Modestobacter marinus]
MLRRPTWTAAISAALVLGLAACGGDSGGDSGGGGGGGGGEAAGRVGVILPDTESSVRWENFDRPYLEAAFEEAGVEADIQNAEGDAQRMTTIAEQMITEGATVLAIVNLDSASGAEIQEQAAAEGVQTIDYDRLTLGGTAEYYVSFDNIAVGRLQGEGLAQCLGEDTEANIAFLNGSPDDNNATLFSQGAHEVLDPIANYTQVAEQAVPGWDNQQAATIFEQMYTQANGEIDGVYAANDGLANSVIQILQRNNAAGIPVTGQDATVEGLQNILAGNQCMTVYKSVRDEANALAELAVALINGEEGQTTGEVEDSEGGRSVPSVLLEPQAIFRDNVKDVVDDEFVSAEDLCTGEFAAACEELGIS